MRVAVERQLKRQAFDRIESPWPLSMWCHFYSKYEQGLPTFDIDGAVTTIIEMLQPYSVSKMGLKAPIYDNDRQIRTAYQTEEEVQSRKFEKVSISIWVPTFDHILDLTYVAQYNLSTPVNAEYDVYNSLTELLD